MAKTKKDDIDRKRFTTLLREDIAAEIKHLAIDKRMLIYEVLEEACKEYIKKETSKLKGKKNT
jgi:hypothetical protein